MNAETTNTKTEGIDRDALEDAIRDNLSPEAVVMIASYLQSLRASAPTARGTIREVEWFREMLIGMVGVDNYNLLLDELGL